MYEIELIIEVNRAKNMMHMVDVHALSFTLRR